MNIAIKLSLALVLGAAGFATAAAQSRTMPVLEVNTDARSAAMAHQGQTQSNRNFLYTNPSAILYGEPRLSVDLGTQFYPSQEGVDGHLTYYNANAAYRLHRNHAVLAGFRYLGGLAFDRVSATGEATKQLKPFDWSIDVGYALRLSPAFSMSATASFVQSYTGRTAQNMAFSLGAAYRKDVRLGFAQQSTLGIAMRLADLGPKLNYGQNYQYDLPSSAILSADLATTLTPGHAVNVGLGGRYFFLPSGETQMLVGLGGEYTWRSMLSARVGYEFGQAKASNLTAGLGLRFAKRYHLDVAYRHALSDYGVNNLLLNLGCAF